MSYNIPLEKENQRAEDALLILLDRRTVGGHFECYNIDLAKGTEAHVHHEDG